MDTFSKSDPCCKVTQIISGTIGTSGYKKCKVGKTEQIKNNLNPDFSKVMAMDYFFE
jgi:hypothetical protein